MPFGTGHTAPANFVAGQLTDGASIGTFILKEFAGVTNPVLAVTLRYYQNKLVGLCEVRKSDGSVLPNENMSIKQREYFQNIFGRPDTNGPNDGPLTNKVDAFKNLIPMLATQAELATMGLNPDGQVPGTGSAKIPYQQDADGKISAFAMPGVPAPNLTPPGTPEVTPPAAGGTGTGSFPAWLKWALIGLGVVALGFGGWMFIKKRKK